jgi:hypothetical protein
MTDTDKSALDGTKQLMRALIAMPPKPHEDTKLGKSKLKGKDRESQAAEASAITQVGTFFRLRSRQQKRLPL